MTVAADRGRQLARQAHADTARASLVKSLNYLSVGLSAARKARIPEAAAFEQAIWEQTNLLTAWSVPGRDQAVAS